MVSRVAIAAVVAGRIGTVAAAPSVVAGAQAPQVTGHMLFISGSAMWLQNSLPIKPQVGSFLHSAVAAAVVVAAAAVAAVVAAVVAVVVVAAVDAVAAVVACTTRAPSGQSLHVTGQFSRNFTSAELRPAQNREPRMMHSVPTSWHTGAVESRTVVAVVAVMLGVAGAPVVVLVTRLTPVVVVEEIAAAPLSPAFPTEQCGKHVVFVALAGLASSLLRMWLSRTCAPTRCLPRTSSWPRTRSSCFTRRIILATRSLISWAGGGRCESVDASSTGPALHAAATSTHSSAGTHSVLHLAG